MNMHSPAHPGLILRDTMGDITVSELARHIGIPRENLSKILNGRQSISAAVALKLSEAYPVSGPEFWLALQNQYDLAQLRKKKRAKVRPLQAIAA